MHKLTFFPLGNAETMLIDLENGRKLLVDFADVRDYNNQFDLRCKLSDRLRDDLNTSNRDDYDVVAFSHLDNDHVFKASEFFWFEHASKYQSDDRAKIAELWVPAAAIVETGVDGDAQVIRAEARYRLKNGKGIRVFSAPDTLRDWFDSEGLDLTAYRASGIVVDAGQVIPGFDLSCDGVEFFVHSPFASRTDDGTLIERNRDAMVLQATFQVGAQLTRALITADVTCDELDEIVRMTRLRKRDERLLWDIYDIPHHCSYKSIGPEKGKEQTEPTHNVAWLMEQGHSGAVLVSSSDSTPSQDTDQPPHRQAAAFYRKIADDLEGEFVVTMEHPKSTGPEPLVIEIGDRGAVRRKLVVPAAVSVVSAPAPRVG